MQTKVFYLFLLAFSFSFALSAQGPEVNQEKYWHYRARFLGQDGNGGFISIGPGAGQSIPMSGRNRWCDCEQDWMIQHQNCSPHPGKGKLEWGDATVYLGYYLVTLSMEYANLKEKHEDLTALNREIYFALHAYERLDSMAEVVLGLEPQLNGFFIRDDVPCDFYLNPQNPINRRFTYNDSTAYDCIQSGGCCRRSEGEVDGGSFISLDQSLALLFGFAFVKKFAGDGKYGEMEDNFGNRVERYTHQMVSYMRDCKWRIKSPGGGSISNRWGGDLRAFNAALADIAENITEGRFDTNYDKNTFAGKIINGTFDWGFRLQSSRNHCMIFQSVVLTNDWSSRKMARRSRRADQIMFALAYSIFNDKKLHSKIKRSDFEKILDSAPWDGPCFGTPDCTAPNGWKSADRWWHSNHKDGNPYGVHHEWTGLDYMLLYNLYHYYYRNSLPNYQKR